MNTSISNIQKYVKLFPSINFGLFGFILFFIWLFFDLYDILEQQDRRKGNIL
jgi:hypothetical protein